MTPGIFLTLLQAIGTFFKDIAETGGEKSDMSHEMIARLIFSSMMRMLPSGQRVFAAIGRVAMLFARTLWGEGVYETPFNASFALLDGSPLLNLPLSLDMGYNPVWKGTDHARGDGHAAGCPSGQPDGNAALRPAVSRRRLRGD